jgi:hypothetical protein
MNLREVGRFLRLIGPLIQLPSLWLLSQRPDYASRNMLLIYLLFFAGLMMVVVGLFLNFIPNRRSR